MRVGNNCPCLWPSGRREAPGAGERGVPHGACPSPRPTPACDCCSRQEHQGATSGVLALRTADSETAHSILRPPMPCQLGGPEQRGVHTPRFSFAQPG